MTIRKDVSVVENLWHDAQNVTQQDMILEQNHNNQIDAAIVQNHFGSGILPNSPEQLTLFDSDNLNATQAALLAAGNFDGTGLNLDVQPADINLGSQLEVELTDSNVLGRLSVKVAIIGLAFDDTLQIDKFYFYRNEKQVTSSHYKRILTVLTNDFKGNNNCSRNLGGRLTIKETASFQLSRDPLIFSQDVSPDIFWRDFKIAIFSLGLFQTLQIGIGPEFDANALNIDTTGREGRELIAGDVTSQVGEKFLAEVNNIQKITLLLGVRRDDLTAEANEFDWAGDLVISIYPLQTTTTCPTDIIPELAIDFDPANVPLAQISYNQTTLKDYGYVLTDVPQPIDFVFSATNVGSTSNSVITVGNIYAITVKRSGAATNGTIFVQDGENRADDSRVTLFNGVWVDDADSDLFIQVYGDSLKISSGFGYDNGQGIMYAKTTTDPTTGAQIDYSARFFPLADSGENVLNTGVIQAIIKESDQVQDERTGNPINDQQQFVPSFSFVTSSALNDLKSVSEPLVVGAAQDANPKINPIITKHNSIPGLAKGNVFTIINPDADLLSNNLLGSKLIPDSTCDAISYRIAKVTLCTDGYGDADGSGTIDENDIVILNGLIGESIFLPSTQQKIADGYIDVLELLRSDLDGDGYITSIDSDLLAQYVARTINSFPVGSSFTRLALTVEQSIGRNDGYFDCDDGYIRLNDGYTIVPPSDLDAAELLFDGYLVGNPIIELADAVFLQVPFLGNTYTISPLPFWQPYLLAVSSEARLVACTFTSEVSTNNQPVVPLATSCTDKNNITPFADPGQNTFFVPSDLIIGDSGQLLRPDGSFYKVDIEIGTVILELPEIPFSNAVINVFDSFIADRGDNSGITIKNFNCMKYADGTVVKKTDLGNIRFGVSIQSIVLNSDGYSETEDFGLIIDPIFNLSLSSNAILSLTVRNIELDTLNGLITKIQITAYIKKAGWVNDVLIVKPTEIAGLISS